MRLSDVFVTVENPDGTKRLAQLSDLPFPLKRKNEAKRCIDPISADEWYQIEQRGELSADQVETVQDLWMSNVDTNKIAAAIGIEVDNQQNAAWIIRILNECGCHYR